MNAYHVAAFYKFIELTELEALQSHLQKLCKENDIFGTILLATEGINGMLAAKPAALKIIIEALRADNHFSDLDIKYSYTDTIPFKKTKVLIKKEIVTLGLPTVRPYKGTGIHVSPNEWHALMNDPEVLVIDTRNGYEIEHGTFRNAINPQTEKFSDFVVFALEKLDKKKHKKIAMCCTGGIRCEKASSYLLALGFENVYQLNGGILKYLETVNENESRWEGKCFVFDDRVSIDASMLSNNYATEKSGG